jgi:hypothetical protein
MPTVEELTEVQTGITNIVKPLLTMMGASNPIIAASLFGVEMLFRFLSLGSQIRAAIEAQKKRLEESVRAEGIIRIPVGVSTKFDDVLLFVEHPLFAARHPLIARQFAREIGILPDPQSPEFPEALRIMDAVRRVIPRVERDLQFRTDPVMDQVFGMWLDPGQPDFRSLVMEFLVLADKEELSLDGHCAAIPEYVRIKLRAAGARLDQATNEAAKQVNDQISKLIRGTLFGDKGAIKSSVKFAVDRRVEMIDGELNERAARKAAIEAKPEVQRSEPEKQELKDIAKRTSELTALRTRVTASLGA